MLNANAPDPILGRCVVPADGMIIECSDDFEMDRGLMTGDHRVRGTTEPSNDSVLASPNVALLGTEVTSGSATCVAINVGSYCEFVKKHYIGKSPQYPANS